MNGNDIVKLALQSPLHLIMGDTMLITVTGRKTGRKITLPVNFVRDRNTLWIISSRDRTWWRNLGLGADVNVHLHGNDLKAFGEIVSNEEAVAVQMGEYVRRLPAAARYMGVRVQNGAPNCEDIARLSKERLFIRICLWP